MEIRVLLLSSSACRSASCVPQYCAPRTQWWRSGGGGTPPAVATASRKSRSGLPSFSSRSAASYSSIAGPWSYCSRSSSTTSSAGAAAAAAAAPPLLAFLARCSVSGSSGSLISGNNSSVFSKQQQQYHQHHRHLSSCYHTNNRSYYYKHNLSNNNNKNNSHQHRYGNYVFGNTAINNYHELQQRQHFSSSCSSVINRNSCGKQLLGGARMYGSTYDLKVPLLVSFPPLPCHGWRHYSSGEHPSGTSGTSTTLEQQQQPASQLTGTRQTDDEVILSFKQGLPHLTVPLPSRRELCRFPLRPVTHTVASLVTQLQTEDRGIDRVVVRSTDGTRVSSSASIESLLLSDFDLIINDTNYRVTVPQHHRTTMEEVSDIADVRQLVNKLYAALHVDEHQVGRERDILHEMEDIRTQLIPLEKHRASLMAAAERRTTVLMYCGLGYMALQFGFLARLTWWEYSWDIMEPVTYFVTYGTAIACYAYYVLTKHEFILPEVRDRQYLLGFHRKARKVGLDVSRYNHLKDRLFTLESDLQRLRDPLALNLPPQHLAKVIAEQSEQGLSRTSPLSALQHHIRTMLKMNK